MRFSKAIGLRLRLTIRAESGHVRVDRRTCVERGGSEAAAVPLAGSHHSNGHLSPRSVRPQRMRRLFARIAICTMTF